MGITMIMLARSDRAVNAAASLRERIETSLNVLNEEGQSPTFVRPVA
jgi:hypothetical protein